MPHLCVHTMNGREYVSVVYGGKHREPISGEFEYIDITDEQAAMTLEVLETMYIVERNKTHERHQVEEDTKATKLSSLLNTLADIIRQSHHDGERENAKALYLKYAGKAFEK